MQIRKIEKGQEIPGLRDSLVQIIHDYRLQVSLQEGCRRILVSDCYHLLRRNVNHRSRGMALGTEATCGCCGEAALAAEGGADFRVSAPPVEVRYLKKPFPLLANLFHRISSSSGAATYSTRPVLRRPEPPRPLRPCAPSVTRDLRLYNDLAAVQKSVLCSKIQDCDLIHVYFLHHTVCSPVDFDMERKTKSICIHIMRSFVHCTDFVLISTSARQD